VSLREALGEAAVPSLAAPDGVRIEAIVHDSDAHQVDVNPFVGANGLAGTLFGSREVEDGKKK
jgi:hypothetical protein